MKQTTQKYAGGLRRATFPTGMKEQCRYYGSHLKIKIGKFAVNQIPSNNEEELGEWSDLTPSIPSSPEVSEFVDKLNSRCPVPVVNTPPPSPTIPTIGETLQLLDEMETRDSTPGSPLPTLHTPPRSPFEEGMTEDLQVEEPPPQATTPIEEAVTSTTMELPEEASPVDETTPTMTSETVSEANTPLVHACPRFPTAAKKYPRKEFCSAKQVAEEAETPLPPPKTLTALQEIWKPQCTYQDILPFALFFRLV